MMLSDPVQAKAFVERTGALAHASYKVDALLRSQVGAQWQERFAAVVSGDAVRNKQPDPKAYRQTLATLALRPLGNSAIKDSPGAVAAARAADTPVLVSRSDYFGAALMDRAMTPSSAGRSTQQVRFRRYLEYL